MHLSLFWLKCSTFYTEIQVLWFLPFCLCLWCILNIKEKVVLTWLYREWVTSYGCKWLYRWGELWPLARARPRAERRKGHPGSWGQIQDVPLIPYRSSMMTDSCEKRLPVAKRESISVWDAEVTAVCTCGGRGREGRLGQTWRAHSVSVRCNFLISRKNKKYFAEEGKIWDQVAVQYYW